MVRADDMQHAVNAGDAIGSTKAKIDRIRNAICFGVEEMVPSSLTILSLEGFSANVIGDQARKRDGAAVPNRAKGPKVIVFINKPFACVCIGIPFFGEHVIAECNLQHCRSGKRILCRYRHTEATKMI